MAAEPRLHALLVFLSQTGARFIEAARLRGTEVFLDRDLPFCVLTTRKNRGAKERKRPQPLTPLVCRAIAPLANGKDTPVFISVTGGTLIYRSELGQLHRLCNRLELPRYSFHQIRHWAGSVATSLGKSKKAVAEFLGQTDTAATERYMHAQHHELWEVAEKLEQEINLNSERTVIASQA